MGKKSQAKHFTLEEQEQLRSNPCIRYVTENKVMWTKEFRTEMYEEWIKEPSPSTIRKCLSEHQIDPNMLGWNIVCHIGSRFKKNGKPSSGGSHELYQVAKFRANEADNAYLVDTGKFVYSRSGISFSQDFAKELYDHYPEQSIEDGLKAAGIDPAMVGYHRIYRLQQVFEGKVKPTPVPVQYSDEQIKAYTNHPYVKRITAKQLVLKPAFYNDAYPLRDLPLKEILEAFELDPELLSFSSYINMQYKLRNWSHTDDTITEVTQKLVCIRFNVMKLLEKQMESDFRELGEMIPVMDLQTRKDLFQRISDLSDDPGRKCSKRKILSLMGVSKTCYYSALKNKDYGKAEAVKAKSDDIDVQAVRQTIEYKGYPKGVRMVYMMMKMVTGKQFGLNKVRRLMRKYDLLCPVRRHNVNRQAARRMLEKNVKPNLLKRQFRIHRPDEVLLTDVTYLTYSDNQTAYASACKDPVTGIIKAFNVSACNDLALIEESLRRVLKYPCAEGMIVHSDQGALYLSETWQKELEDLGFIQSMSKRGNCWDNAPQESFFGHFKDEEDYSDARTIEDLEWHLGNYTGYYNNRRPQWTRNRMTPVAYRDYLLSLSDEEYRQYLGRETARYQAMKKKAEREAVTRAKTLGV